MLSLIASLIILLGAIVLAIGMRMSRQARAANSDIAKIENKVAGLESLVDTARHESQRLEAAIAKAEALRTRNGDSLAMLEALADPAALDDPQAMERAAADVMRLPADVASDIFTADEKTLKIARLIHQGHSLAEIARRLHLPLGEVELLMSMRPKSTRP